MLCLGKKKINALKTNVCSCLSQAPSLDEKVNLHFIAFVNVGGHLYELGESPTAEERKHLVICLTFSIGITLIAHLAVIKLFCLPRWSEAFPYCPWKNLRGYLPGGTTPTNETDKL